jgi:hypothetical protein
MAGRKRTKKNMYFTKIHENAIIEYVATDDPKTRTQLYKEFIGPAFSEMVDKIVYTYKFTNLPNIDSLKDDCKNWLITILDKYDVNKGSKAFSYFSVTTKNWFVHKIKKNSLKVSREVLIEKTTIDIRSNHPLVTHNSYLQDREKNEFWNHLWVEIQGWEKLKLKENEKKIIQAIKILFESSEDIEIFNKKAIYLYIREITGLNTKQVVNNLNKIRIKYRNFKSKWDNNEN